MTTQSIVLNHNPQSIMAATAAKLWVFLVVFALMAIGMAVGAAIVAVVVAFWWPLVQVSGCLCVIALFAVVTFPKAVK